MKKAVMALAILGLVLVLGTRAEALVTTCSNGVHIVNTLPLAQALAAGGGYANDQCELTILTSIPGINVQQFILKARGLIIDGPDVLNPAVKIQIINPIAGGEIALLSEGGQDIRIDNAIIQARSVIKTVCSGAVCRIKVDNSEIVAANPLGDLTSQTGDLYFSAVGDIDINTSTIYGGAGIHMGSDTGHVVFICLGGGGVCTDPLTSGVQQALCGNPPVYPCTPTFADAAALRAVCFPGTPPATCGGGSKEIRIFALGFVDITGTTLIVLDHISIESGTADVRAANSTIVAEDAINVKAKTTVNMQDATWTSRRISVEANCVGSPAPAICINANGADLKAVEVIGINANNAAGVVTVCNAASLDVPGSNLVVLNGGVCDFPPNGAGPNTKVTAPQCVAPFGAAPAVLCK